jgi:glycosyltransferase involved in cell wall biosynthesis
LNAFAPGSPTVLAPVATERPLEVGLNLLYLVRESGGSSTYARELIKGMLSVEPETRITAFVSKEAPEDVLRASWASAVDWVRIPVNVTHGPPGNFAVTMMSQWAAMPLLAARRGLDVIHGLANVAPLVAPRVATVVTLLDLIWMHHPDALDRRARVGMKMVAPVSARRADRVIAISEAARQDMIKTIDLDPTKIDVTHLGISPEPLAPAVPAGELRDALKLGPEPVVLCVAQKRTHKNLAALVRAIALARTEPQLVLPGSRTSHQDELSALAGELGVAHRVHFPDWVTDEQLEGLYAMARCFVLPSLQEGFGLPILEAMRRGVPVACSNVSSLPEVAGDAALLFDPASANEIAAAIDRVVEDEGLRADLAERGAQRCSAFTWERTAEATLAVYRRAIGCRTTRRGR